VPTLLFSASAARAPKRSQGWVIALRCHSEAALARARHHIFRRPKRVFRRHVFRRISPSSHLLTPATLAGAFLAPASIQQEPVQSKEHFLKQWELTMMLADAKARIAIYGSKAVVTVLAALLHDGYHLTGKRAKDFTAVCQLMRRDTRPTLDSVNDKDMHFLLFDVELGK
jgi:hypothetical protein